MRCLAALLLVGCGRVAFDPLASGDGGASGDADASDGQAACTTFSPFGAITHISSANAATGFEDWAPEIHPSGLLIVFQSNRVAGSALYAVTRPTTSDVFGPARELTELYGAGTQDGGDSPMLSSDGSQLYYLRYVAIGTGPVVAPFLGGDSFGAPTVVDLPYPQVDWALSRDSLELFYTDRSGAPIIIRHATRANMTAPWVDDNDAAAVNDVLYDCGWASFDDERQDLYFEAGGPSGSTIMVARRPGPGMPFGGPTAVTELGTDAVDPDISPDGLTIAFGAVNRAGGAGATDLYYATRTCL